MGDLIQRLEALTGPINTRVHMPMWLYDAHRTFNGEACSALADAIAGSLDAAERFRQAVLPGSGMGLGISAQAGDCTCDVWVKADDPIHVANHPSAPIAILIACLRALDAKDPTP